MNGSGRRRTGKFTPELAAETDVTPGGKMSDILGSLEVLFVSLAY